MIERWIGSLAFCVVTGMASAGSGGGTILLESDFSGTSPASSVPWAATSVPGTGFTFSGWNFGPGTAGDPTVDDALGLLVTAGATPSTLEEAVADQEYLTCTITPDPGTPLNLNGARIEFTTRRLSWHAPRQYSLMTSVSGFTAADALYTSPAVDSSVNWNVDHGAFLPTSGYDGLTQPVEIRIYAHEANYGGHTSSLAGFRVRVGVQSYTLSLAPASGGTVSAVPDRSVFEAGEMVQLHATPDGGQRFAGWGGDVTGFGNPRTITMDADRSVAAAFEATPAPAMVTGFNLDGVVDWASSWIFTDVFRRTRTWLSRNADQSGAWDTGVGWAVPHDAQGWPTVVPFDPANGLPPQMVHTILVLANEPGDYVMTYEGEGVGRFRVDGVPHTITVGGSHTIPVTWNGGAISLEIESTQPAPNHIRNVRLVHADHLGIVDSEPFHPLFRARLAPGGIIRFMDWANTNASPVSQWSQRTPPDAYTQSQSAGVAPEVMIDLANRLGQDAWFCVPHMADDTCVRELARLIRDTLDPTLAVWVEYSNETWNSAGAFTQTTWVQDQGEALGLSTNRWEAGQFYVALRSAEIWRLFEEEFGAASDRLVRVMATQGSNINVTHMRVAALTDPAINPDALMPDALAIAPYFGRNYAPSDLPPNQPAYPDVDDILDVETPQSLAQVATWVAEQRAVADVQGWDLVCYEAGQHFVGIAGAENDNALTQVLAAANRDPRMYGRYLEYLDLLRDGGVRVCAMFSFCGQWSKWGSWGTLEDLDQPLDQAPKYRAIIDWIQREACPGDTTGDAGVNFDDLNDVLDHWNTSGPGPLPGDADLSGQVDFGDLNVVLAEWGNVCP
ncbi:MAG: hypothetical protein KDA21_00975 [Phycisphaerales bacterium]|nr:hypothetical protein [Phycisphaerales bacterium]